MKLSIVAREEHPISHAKRLICEGYGRVWNMAAYQGWIVDPKPRVLVFGSWVHPNTGNTLVGGVNLNYLNPEQIERLRWYLPEILAQTTLKARYWEGKRLLPDVFDNKDGYYRTYDRSKITYVRPEVFKFMTPNELAQSGKPEQADQLATRRDVYKTLKAGRQSGEPIPSLQPDVAPPPETAPEEPPKEKLPEAPPEEPPAPPAPEEEPKTPEEQEKEQEQDVKTTQKVAKDLEKSTGKKLLDRIDQRLRSIIGGVKSWWKKPKPEKAEKPAEIPEKPPAKPKPVPKPPAPEPEKTPEEKDIDTTKKVAKDLEKSTGKKLLDRIDQKLKSLFGGVKSLWKGKKKPPGESGEA